MSSGNVQPFLNHARVIAGNNDVNMQYLINFFADIVQFPGRLSCVAIVLWGKQGAGKNLLTDFLIKRVLGKDLGFDTAKPEHDLFGKFQNGRMNKLLIAVNEARGKDTFPNADLLKDMITSTTFSYEAKGVNPIVLATYARMIFTTNNDNPIKIEEGDRRFVVFDCGSNFVQNHEYFDMLRAYVADPCNAKAVFEYLKAVNLSSVNLARDRPIIEAYNEIKKAAVSFEHKFLKDLTERPEYKEQVVNFTASGLFEELQEWKTKNRMTLDVNASVFGRKISKLAKETEGTHIRPVHTKKGNGYVIDMQSLRSFMVEKKYIKEDDFEVLPWQFNVVDDEDVNRQSKR